MPEAALAEDQIARRKRKLDFDEQPPTKKRPENRISLSSRPICLGKRKQPAHNTEKPKRPRVATTDDSLQEHDQYEDVFKNLSVIEMPLSIRAQAYLQDPKPSQTIKQKEAKVDEGYARQPYHMYQNQQPRWI
ncbi:hypothetical protein IWW42_004730 [Coemansia sp. RSA 1085]|nr:hypothetical protein IWW42_004730 [Coemansia sp. RSA 1085]